MKKSEWKLLLEGWDNFVKEGSLICEGASEKEKNDRINQLKRDRDGYLIELYHHFSLGLTPEYENPEIRSTYYPHWENKDFEDVLMGSGMYRSETIADLKGEPHVSKSSNPVTFFDFDPRYLDKKGINNTNIFEEIYAYIRDNADYFPDDMIKDIEKEGVRSKYYYKHNIKKGYLSTYHLLFVNNTKINLDFFLEGVFEIIDDSNLRSDAKQFLKDEIEEYKERPLVFNPAGISAIVIDKYDIHVFKDAHYQNNPNYNNISVTLPQVEYESLDRKYSREVQSQIKKEVRDKTNDLINNYYKNPEAWEEDRKLFYEFSMLDQLSEEENLYAHSLIKIKEKLGYSDFIDSDFQYVIESIDGEYIDKEKTRELISQGITTEEYLNSKDNELYEKKIKDYEEMVDIFLPETGEPSSNPLDWSKNWNDSRANIYRMTIDPSYLDEANKSHGTYFTKEDIIDLIKEIEIYYRPENV